jgi:hypothetical protein
MAPTSLIAAPFQTVSVVDSRPPRPRADLTTSVLTLLVGGLLSAIFVVALRNPPAMAIQALLGGYLFTVGAWVFAQARS